MNARFPTPRLLAAALALALVVFPAAMVRADAPSSSGATDASRIDPDSPRASWQSFSRACRDGHYDDAAKWLDVPKQSAQADGARLAMELDAVLRRYTTLEDDDFSPRSDGDTTDSFGAYIDEVARIPHGAAQGSETVRLVRRVDDAGVRWVFSRPTVRSIDAWYNTLEDRWIRPHLPKAFLREGPFDLLVWQCLAILVAVPLILVLGRLAALAFITAARRLLLRLFGETASLPSIVAPLQLLLAATGGFTVLRFLALDPLNFKIARGALVSCIEVAILWAGARSVDLIVDRARHTPLGHLPLFEAGLLPLVTKMTKLGMVIVAAILTLANLGYQVGSLLAGLGIGGLAFALAAQKTVENLFGAAAIGLDQPFRIGDPVNIDGIKGVVEGVGIRSTRIRTEGRSVVSMPNAKVAEMRIENFATRDRFLLAATLPIPIVYLGKLGKLLERLDDTIEAHPARVGQGHAATVSRIGSGGFDVDVKGYFRADDAIAFERLRHHVFLQLVAVLTDMRIELTPAGGVFRLEGSFDKASGPETP